MRHLLMSTCSQIELSVLFNSKFIGETLEVGTNKRHICGAIVQSRRRVDRVGIWTADAADVECVRHIGEKYRGLLKPSFYQKLKYQSHESGQNRQSSSLDHLIVL